MDNFEQWLKNNALVICESVEKHTDLNNELYSHTCITLNQIFHKYRDFEKKEFEKWVEDNLTTLYKECETLDKYSFHNIYNHQDIATLEYARFIYNKFERNKDSVRGVG